MMTDNKAGPLAGIRILELKGIGPGPYAGMLLADLGAEVIVVERASKATGIGLPSAHDVHSRGKRSIALDLKNPAGRKLLFELVATSDALIEGFRPGVAERLGCGPEDCWQVNPSLVYGRVTGWGQSGPLAHTAGHDINYIGLTGALAAMGDKQKPALPLNLVGDYAGGSLFLVMGVLAALLEAQKTGKGQVVDAAITDGVASMMSLFSSFNALGLWNPERAANLLDGAAHFYDTYETADGKFMAVGPIEPQFYQEFLAVLAIEEPSLQSQQPTDWAVNKSQLQQIFLRRTQSEWTQVFDGSDACVTPVLGMTEAAAHPHNQARKAYVEAGGILQPGIAPKFSDHQIDVCGRRPSEGADTRALMASLGYDEAAIDQLIADGILT